VKVILGKQVTARWKKFRPLYRCRN